MSVSANLRDALRAAPAINAIVDQRVYRDERPQGSPLAAIVILLVSDPRPLTFNGPQSVRSARLQIDCLADSRGAADALGEVVIGLVDGRALSAVDTFESARVLNVRNDRSRDTQATTFRTAIDLMVWHHPSI